MLEIIEESLQHGKATCVAFNRRGTLLAAGTSGGSIAIFDFCTRSVARELVPEALADEDGDDQEVPAVFSVAWSSDGRKILSTAADGSVVVWDVAESDMSFRAALDSQPHSAQFRPRDDNLALVCPSDDGPMTLALGRGRKRTPLPQMPGFYGSSYGGENRACRVPSGGLDPGASRIPGIATYSKSGRYVFVANNRGTLTVVECGTMDIVQACRIPGAEEGGTTYVKKLELSRDGKRLLAVTTAKEIASYDVRDEVLNVNDTSTQVLTTSPSLHNPVSRSQWAAACFSHDGEYVVAASGGSPHELHMWRRRTGELVRILQGGPEAKGIAQLTSHPHRSLVIAVGANGQLYAWAKKYAENWSAFDPTFVELEENIKLTDNDDDEFDLIARNAGDPTGVIARAIEAPNAVALDAAKAAAVKTTAAEKEAKIQSDFDDRSYAFELWAGGREGSTVPERPTWRDPPALEEFKRRSEGFDAWAREREGVSPIEPPARDAALTSTLDELLGPDRSDAAEDAAQRAHAASLVRSAAIKAAEESRRARVEAAKLAAEKEAAEIRAEVIDVSAPCDGYYTDEGEDCMHYLPLEQLEPQADAVNVVQVRLERWKRKEMRLTASAEKRPRLEGEPDGEDEEEPDVKEDLDEDDDDDDDDDEMDEDGDEEGRIVDLFELEGGAYGPEEEEDDEVEDDDDDEDEDEDEEEDSDEDDDDEDEEDEGEDEDGEEEDEEGEGDADMES